MTKEQAIEICGRAMATVQFPKTPDDFWKSIPGNEDAARKLVLSLVGLGILKVDE